MLFLLGVLLFVYLDDRRYKTTFSEVTIDCKGLDIVNTSYCLRNELQNFFFYNISNAGKDLSLDEFRSLGGVCHHASLWYVDKLKALGGYFVEDSKRKYTQPINCTPFCIVNDIVPTSSTTAHEYVIISNIQYMCKLDQLNVYCMEFKQ
jgi:hypothetical protein